MVNKFNALRAQNRGNRQRRSKPCKDWPQTTERSFVMQDVLSTLNGLRRPPLLIRAARIGVCDYNRAVHLPRHLGPAALPRAAEALIRLMEIEAALERDRAARATGYRAARHVEVLIAMLGEARIIRAGQTAPA